MTTRGTIALVAIAGWWIFGCSGGGRQIAIGPPPAKATSGTLSGALCEGQSCKCRGPGDDAGAPEGARKRYEIRLGPTPHDLWLTLPNTVLYKSPERAEMCFYVDLPPGEHPVELRASNPDGISAAVIVRELGVKTASWYDSFQFACGSPGVCSFEELDGKKAEYAQVKKNLHDPCGSTKIKGLTWDTGKAPDQLHPSELVVRFVLDVYKFEPTKAHGDATCGAGDGNRRRPKSDEPAGEPPANP
jgi:hypothetical protein